jgi:hypothetical protein
MFAYIVIMKVSTSITLERETFEKLKELAKREERSVSYILNRLLRDALRQAQDKPPDDPRSIGFHSPENCSRGGCIKCRAAFDQLISHLRSSGPAVIA